MRTPLTGSNADERVRVLPSEERAIAFGLAQRVAKATGVTEAIAAPTTDNPTPITATANHRRIAPPTGHTEPAQSVHKRCR